MKFTTCFTNLQSSLFHLLFTDGKNRVLEEIKHSGKASFLINQLLWLLLKVYHIVKTLVSNVTSFCKHGHILHHHSQDEDEQKVYK